MPHPRTLIVSTLLLGGMACFVLQYGPAVAESVNSAQAWLLSLDESERIWSATGCGLVAAFIIITALRKGEG